MSTVTRFAALLLASVAAPAVASTAVQEVKPEPSAAPQAEPAPAQTTDPAAPVAAEPATPSAATPVASQSETEGAAGADAQQIQDVVVTATKVQTNLQSTPIAISVLGDETIKERRVQSLLDLSDGGIPSLRIATFEARQSALTIGIRGIVPLDANQPAREQGVGVYIDGVYLGRQHGLNAGLFDVERIEVLKGPQGTLFGRNTEGGALSIVTRAPTGELGGNITASTGNLDQQTLAAHLNLPEIAGFKIKLDGVKQHQGPVTENPMPGQAGFGLFDRTGVRAAVRWQPVDGITNDFAYDWAKDENTPFYSQLLNYNPNGCLSGGSNTAPLAVPSGSRCVTPGTAFTGTQGTIRPLLPGVVVNGDTLMRTADIGVPQKRSVDKTFGYSNTLRWNIADEIELRSITAWRGVDVQQWDNSGGAHRVPVVNLTASCTAAAPCPFSRYSLADLHQRQFSQELQAVGTIGPVDYVAGLYYFNERVSDDAATPNSLGAVAIRNAAGQVIGANYVTIPFCTASTPLFVGEAVNGCSIDRASAVRSRSYAAYGQATWNATDALHITVGGRYTKDKKTGQLLFSRGNPTVVGVNQYQPLDRTWDRFNPLATVAYDFSPTIHAYAKYATGYRAGGASSRTSNYQAFDPEDVKSYEIGLKSEFLDRRVRFNLAGYMMDRTGSQVDLSTIQPTTTGSFNNLVTLNAPGTTRIRGVEADLTVRPVTGLQLTASYAYTYTRIPPVNVTYTAGTSSTTVPQQFYIVFTPRNAASGSIDYEFPMDNSALRFHLDGNYSQATQSFDQFATKNDASFIVNGRISLADIRTGSDGSRLTLSVWTRNLFDRHYVYRRDPSNSLPAVQTAVVQGVPNIVAIGNNGGILGDYGNFNLPRTYGIEASVNF